MAINKKYDFHSVFELSLKKTVDFLNHQVSGRKPLNPADLHLFNEEIHVLPADLHKKVSHKAFRQFASGFETGVSTNSNNNFSPELRALMGKKNKELKKIISRMVAADCQRRDAKKTDKHAALFPSVCGKNSSSLPEFLLNINLEEVVLRSFGIASAINPKYRASGVPVFLFVQSFIDLVSSEFSFKKKKPLFRLDKLFIRRFFSEMLSTLFVGENTSEEGVLGYSFFLHKQHSLDLQEKRFETNCIGLRGYEPVIKQLYSYLKWRPAIMQPKAYGLRGADADYSIALRTVRNKKYILPRHETLFSKQKKIWKNNKWIGFSKKSRHLKAANKFEASGYVLSPHVTKAYMLDVLIPQVKTMLDIYDNGFTDPEHQKDIKTFLELGIGLPGTVEECTAFIEKHYAADSKAKKKTAFEVVTEAHSQHFKFKKHLERLFHVTTLNGNRTYPRVSLDFRGRFYMLGSLSFTDCKFVRYLIVFPQASNFCQEELDLVAEQMAPGIAIQKFQVGVQSIIEYKVGVYSALREQTRSLREKTILFLKIKMLQIHKCDVLFLDATSSALQVLALLENDPEMLEDVNLYVNSAKPTRRSRDPYSSTLPKSITLKTRRIINMIDIPRAARKAVTMTFLYGSPDLSTAVRLLKDGILDNLYDQEGAPYGLSKMDFCLNVVTSLRKGFSANYKCAPDRCIELLKKTFVKDDASASWAFKNESRVYCKYMKREDIQITFQTPTGNHAIRYSIPSETDVDRRKANRAVVANFFHTLDSYIVAEVLLTYKGFMVPCHDAFFVNSGEWKAVAAKYSKACVFAQKLAWSLLKPELVAAGFTTPTSVTQHLIARSKYGLLPSLF